MEHGEKPTWAEEAGENERARVPERDVRGFGITDENIHALVGYGSHGKKERIQDLLCQACGTKLTERKGSVLYRLKTAPQRVGEVLAALAEGLDVAAALRVFGHTEATIQRWLTRAGMHAEQMHGRFFCQLSLMHVQLDEIKTRLRARVSELWLWVAMDAQAKVVAVFELGPRTQEVAHRLPTGLGQHFALPTLPTAPTATAAVIRSLERRFSTSRSGRLTAAEN